MRGSHAFRPARLIKRGRRWRLMKYPSSFLRLIGGIWMSFLNHSGKVFSCTSLTMWILEEMREMVKCEPFESGDDAVLRLETLDVAFLLTFADKQSLQSVEFYCKTTSLYPRATLVTHSDYMTWVGKQLMRWRFTRYPSYYEIADSVCFINNLKQEDICQKK